MSIGEHPLKQREPRVVGGFNEPDTYQDPPVGVSWLD